MKYGHILSALAEEPWAITLQKFAEIRDLMEFRANGGVLTDEQIEARIGDAPKATSRTEGMVAVVPVHGVIYPRANMMTDISGGVSLEKLTGQMEQLVADPAIKAVVNDYDTPGGSVVGVQEYAEKLRAWRKVKPIIAVGNHMIASAGYWMAANSTEIVATKSASIGSIGVYMTHVDESQALEKAGVKIRILSAGKFKAQGGSHEPLSEEAEGHIMERINEVYGWMVRDIAKGMGVKAEDVRNGFGEGRVLGAERALAAGMIHRIASLEDVIREQVGGKRSAGGMRVQQAVLPEGIGATFHSEAETMEETEARMEAPSCGLSEIAPGQPKAIDDEDRARRFRFL